jgi:RNA polymerase sigma factor (sigma-70 family)
MKNMTDSRTLLAQYVREGSESAFRELVTNYIDLVYSTALRLVSRDSHAAEDVTQMVFLALARKAPTLCGELMLGGWLHQHTRYVAAKLLRGERRRRAREKEAAEMNQPEGDSQADLAQIAPMLDEAIGQLGTADRTAILLRFFEQKDLRSVGLALGSTEEAARKRVARALDKLHGLLSRRGIALSARALGTALAAGVVTAAPAGLAGSVAGAALAGTTIGGTTVTLLKILTMTKLKFGIISALLVVGMGAIIVEQQQANKKLRAELSEKPGAEGTVVGLEAHPVQGAQRTAVLENIPRLDWRQVESPDYRTYIKNLRSVGCPEQTIRDIVVADVNAFFNTKERSGVVLTNRIMYWRSNGTDLRQWVKEQLIQRRQESENSRIAVLKELLGENTPLEDRPTNVADADLIFNLVDFVAPQERSQVSDAVMEFDDAFNAKFKPLLVDGKWDDKAREEYVEFYQNRAAKLLELLGPDRVENYALRDSPLAHWLRFRYQGIDFSEEEFRQLFRFAKQFELSLDVFAHDFSDEQQLELNQTAQLAVWNKAKELLGSERLGQRSISTGLRRFGLGN